MANAAGRIPRSRRTVHQVDGKARIRLRQDGEELPFLAIGQSLGHNRILPQNCSAGALPPRAAEQMLGTIV